LTFWDFSDSWLVMIQNQLRAIPPDALQALTRRLDELCVRAKVLSDEMASLSKDIEHYDVRVKKESKRRDAQKTASLLLKGQSQLRPVSAKARCEKSVKLLEAIKRLGEMSTEQIAQYVGVSSYTVSRWEAGQMGPSGPASRALHRLLEQVNAE
jgi:DNA-binding transcriptional regulator YiaG